MHFRASQNISSSVEYSSFFFRECESENETLPADVSGALTDAGSLCLAGDGFSRFLVEGPSSIMII